MSFELPLFPLDVVLFPGMPLPLHIFEPRYRLMIGRCLRNESEFGVALLIEGNAGESGTVPTQIGCSARILDVSPFAGWSPERAKCRFEAFRDPFDARRR
jgi:Lon protease-like protein